MIVGLAHACFKVANLEQSLKFYVDGLGFKPAFDFNRPDGSRFGVYLKAGDRLFIELFENAEAAGERPQQSFAHLCLEVDDMGQTIDGLRALGIEVSDPKLGTDQSWQAWLSDPDGNRFELHQYTPDSWQTPHLS